MDIERADPHSSRGGFAAAQAAYNGRKRDLIDLECRHRGQAPAQAVARRRAGQAHGARHEFKIATLAEQRVRTDPPTALANHGEPWLAELSQLADGLDEKWQTAISPLAPLRAERRRTSKSRTWCSAPIVWASLQ